MRQDSNTERMSLQEHCACMILHWRWILDRQPETCNRFVADTKIQAERFTHNTLEYSCKLVILRFVMFAAITKETHHIQYHMELFSDDKFQKGIFEMVSIR